MSQLAQKINAAFAASPSLSKKYAKWFDQATKLANVLNMQFDRKKAAFEAMYAGNQRSGKLDVSRLSEYKTSEDLFMQTKINPQGRNYHFNVLLDWSGSMSGVSERAMQQATIQALFLRKQRIPFSVFFFGYRGSRNKVTRANEIRSDGAELNELYYDKQSHENFIAATKLAFAGCMIVAGAGAARNEIHAWSRDHVTAYNAVAQNFGMGCTPLDLCLVELYNMMRSEFQAKPSVCQNLVLITDGASDFLYVSDQYATPIDWNGFYTKVDGRHHNFAARGDLQKCGTANTWKLLNMFDWGVNRTLIYLTDSHNDAIHLLLNSKEYGLRQKLEASIRVPFRDGKVVQLSNVYGGVDNLFVVNTDVNAASMSDIQVQGANTKKAAAAMAKQFESIAKGDPINTLATVVADAMAKNFRTGDQNKVAPSDNRTLRIDFREIVGTK